MTMNPYVLAALALTACATLDDEPLDGEHDTIGDPKADSGPSPAHVLAALTAANTASVDALTTARVDPVAIGELLQARTDGPIETLAALDEIPHVGQRVFAGLVAVGEASVVSGRCTDPTSQAPIVEIGFSVAEGWDGRMIWNAVLRGGAPLGSSDAGGSWQNIWKHDRPGFDRMRFDARWQAAPARSLSLLMLGPELEHGGDVYGGAIDYSDARNGDDESANADSPFAFRVPCIAGLGELPR